MQRLIIYIIVLFAGVASESFAQRTATSTITNFNRTGATYSFEIWGRRTNASPSILVGISQFFLNYNSSALSTPTLANINPKYTGEVGVDDYDPMDVAIVSGKIAVTIRFTGNNTGVGGALSTVSPDGERICTVNMTITGAGNADLTWDIVNSAITTSNSQPVVNSFVGADGGPLPITLSSFTATVVNQNRVRLNWTTLTETNNYGFEAQESQGNQDNYQTIPNSFVAGHGTTLEPQTYSFVDSSAPAGQWFYRLKQIDLDGTIHFTDGVQVDVLTGVAEKPLPKEFALDQNYPNPFNPSTRIEYAVPAASHVRLDVYNVIGQLVATLVDEVRPAGYYAASFNASSFSSGLYFYRMTAGKASFLKKMMLVK